jgi:hypothetical protein
VLCPQLNKPRVIRKDDPPLLLRSRLALGFRGEATGTNEAADILEDFGGIAPIEVVLLSRRWRRRESTPRKVPLAIRGKRSGRLASASPHGPDALIRRGR